MLPTFLHFLQDGFLLRARVGCSIREFLRERCGLSPQKISGRIRTLFLDGMPVDDIDHAFIKNGSTLALSGAMPGLVGAVLRSNSQFRSFRSGITHGVELKGENSQPGMVHLKLFNTVMSELAPRFFQEGILLQPVAVLDFLNRQPEHRRSGIKEVLLDSQPIELTRLLDSKCLSRSELIALSVRIHE